MKIAKEHEKRYEWLQAAGCYKKASDLALDEKDFLKTADFQEKIAFSLFRAAFQSETNTEFKERMKLAIQAYKKEIKILETSKEDIKQVRIKQAEASVAYTRSWLEENPKKRKKLLDEWWTLGNQVLEAHESAGDIHSVGLVCTDLIEFSQYTRIWLSNFSEEVMLEREAIRLAEKAIHALSKSNDYSQLARAYCFASIWYCANAHEAPEFRDKLPQIIQKGYDYSKKALELALPTGDAWLIGWAFSSAWTAVVYNKLNHHLGAENGEKILKYGVIAKDKLLLSRGMQELSYSMNILAEFMEDPDKQRESFKKAKNLAQECVKFCQIINHIPYVCFGFSSEISSLNWLAKIETDPENKKEILQNAIKKAREGLEVTREWTRLSGLLYGYLSGSLSLLSGTRSDIEEKKALLLEAQLSQKKHIIYIEQLVPFHDVLRSIALYELGLVQIELAKTEGDKKGKAEFLEKAVVVLEKSRVLAEKTFKFRSGSVNVTQLLGKHNDTLGRPLQQIYYLTGDGKRLSEAIKAHQRAAAAFMKGEMPSHAAESYWFMAQLHGHKGEHQEASKNYRSASELYDQATEKIPQLKDFYKNHSLYMQAWSQIELARYYHCLEDYEKAAQHYEQAAERHESTSLWSYLTQNYYAWANMEKAESLSRNEQTELAKQTFQKALQQFNRAEESIKEKLKKISSEEEREMIQRLLKASDLRRKYCQARILMEDAKLLDREGKYLQSSSNYGKAAQNFSAIVDKIDVEAERKELEYIAILCQAWEKMANAEEATSSESYLEAAQLFEKAKDYCYTKKASLWALGNSNFCRGLAAGVKYQTGLELEEHAKAKSFMKSASTNYAKAGFKAASEYARATQRLFDAYAFMNQAENELDQEKRAKQYQMAENLLQIAAGSFMKAKQPEKTAQVQEILVNVREEKTLAISLSQVMQAPTIASTTLAFTAPTPTSEVSVGLEPFRHANVQANLVTNVKEVKVGESFCLSVEFVNAGREPALLMRVDDFVPPDFVVVKKPEIYRLEENCLNMKGKQLAPLKLVEVKLTLQPSKKGEYRLNPRVHYLDELGQTKSLQLKTVEIKVEEILLEDRVSTGTQELDSLLLGGIPNEYAVVLAGPPCDEREIMMKNFLKAGADEGDITFYISKEAVDLDDLLAKPNFILFLCNPKPKAQVPDIPNVYKLRGKTDLTNLGIALAKACRGIGKSVAKRRVCVEILSDVLVEYGAKTAREWMSGLITDLGSKGFTLLAVMDPKEHPTDQATTVLNLFDGEIELTQTEDPLECKKSIRVKKLRNQDYIKNPICLTNK